jgi:carboxymethylenebutenolidase
MANVKLRASDGHQFDAHRVDPLGQRHGGVVVVQEIFGVNRHMQAVAARFATAGWSAIVPAFFDRITPGVELGYTPEDFARGRELVGKLQMSDVMLDLQAAIDELSPEGEVGVVGYCWGGSVVWLGAARLERMHVAVSYYGSRIVNYADERPRVPTTLHVGRGDASFPIEKVREIGKRYTELAIHEYDAGHGFDCDHRPDFDSTASTHAMTRTLAWLHGPIVG